MVRMGAWRRGLALLCLLVAVLATTGVASGSAATSPWDVPVPPILDSSTWSRDPVWQRAQGEALTRESAQPPAAAQTPEQSATAFGDLSRPESQDLAQQTFPDMMLAPVDALGLPQGDHVTSYDSPTEASVEDEHGKHLMLIGTEPFATTGDSSGDDLSKVDLSLSAKDGALVPDNPAVDVQLPESAADPLTLPDSRLSVSMGEGADVAGRVESDRVFYGEVSTDTDYITVPQREGAQVMWQLRSPQATESPSLNLDLPAGEHARLTSMLTGATSDENPSVQIVTDDNTVMDTIAAPSAVDAAGVSVPAHYRLDGDRLYVDVAHREQPVNYPVLVDPEVREVWGGTDWYNMGTGTNSVMAGQWGFTPTEGNYGNPWFLANNANPVTYGMAIESWPGSYLYTAGAGAYDYWRAPAYANIASVWFDGFYHRSEGDHLFAGVIGPYGWESVYNIYGDEDYDQSSQTPSPAWENSAVVFGVFEDMTTTHPVPGWVAVRGVNILVGDTRPPTTSLAKIYVDGTEMPWARHDFYADGTNHWISPWVSTASTVTVNPVASDLGLGLKALGVFTMNNNWIGTPWQSGCIGHRGSPCPQAIGGYWQNLPLNRGYTDMRTAALDTYGNLGLGDTWLMRVDGDSPKISLGGDTVDHRSDGTLGYNPTITIDVRDDRTSSLLGAYDQSGVGHVYVSLDTDPATGQPRNIYTWSRPSGCADNCDANFQLTLPATTPGTHRLWVVATDGANHAGNYSDPDNSGYLSFTVRNDTSWTYGGANHTIDTDGEAATVGQLLAGAGWQTVWNGLSTTDKDGMMAAEDPYFSSWVSKVDNTPPAAPDTVVVDNAAPATRTASFSWSPGEDPDLQNGVQGSGPDELHGEYRYRRAGGSFSSWIASDSMSGMLPSVDAGDVLDVDVRQYDAAGNASAYVRTSLTVPAVTAHAAFVWAAPLLCVAGGCEAAAPILIGVGTVAAGVFVADNVHWSVKREGSESDIPIADEGPTLGLVNGETEADWQQRGKSQRRTLRTKLRNLGKLRGGQQAHHIVPVADERADELRRILYECGIDLNDPDNGVGLSPRDHYQTFSRAYFNDLDKILGRHDPDKSISPCDEFRDDPVHGLRATLRAVAKALSEGTFFH